jgi:hypothetical protein
MRHEVLSTNRWTSIISPTYGDIAMSKAPAPGSTDRAAGQWWSIEVLHGHFSAHRWRDAHGRALFEAAVTHGALDWSWQSTQWGLVLEIEFRDSDAWSTYRQLPGVQAALDAVPDPVRGLFVFPGRGGSSGARKPLRPRPRRGAGGAALPSSPEPIIVAKAAEASLAATAAGA